MEQAYTAFSNGKTCTFDNFKRALERCRKRGALRNVPLRPNQINQPQLTYRFLDEHVQQFFVWRAVPSIRRWACDISVFRFYIRRVTAGLRTCMPAVSMITLTIWYFYDTFMHLDWENYPVNWSLSIVLALFCDGWYFLGLKLKRVLPPQPNKMALFLSPFLARHTSRFWSYVLSALMDLQNSFCFHLLTLKLDFWKGQKRFSSLRKKSVGLPTNRPKDWETKCKLT